MIRRIQRLSGRRLIASTTLAVICSTSIAFAQSPKPRKWKDASGKFEIEATFVSEANGVVTLKQTNGEEVEIEVKQLSPADEAYIKNQMAASASPFKSKSSSPAPSPFKSNSKSSTKSSSGSTRSAPSDAGLAELTGDPDTIAVQWTSAALIAAPDQTKWNAISISPAPSKKLKSSQLPNKRDFSEKFENMIAGDGFALLGYTYPDILRKGVGDTTRLVRVNTETGKVEGTIIVDGLYTLLDASADGEQMLMRKEGALGKPSMQLEIWKPAGKVVERLASFLPFAMEDQVHQTVEQAFLGPNGKIVVLGKVGGRAGIFDATTGNSVSTLLKAHAACISPDRKYAAILGDSLFIVDIQTGDAVASLPCDKKYGAVVAFSPDGKRLAAAFLNGVTAWDLTTGEVYRDETYASMGAGQHASFVWTSPTHVLVGTTLIDLENHLPLWMYIGVDKAASSGSTTLLADSEAGSQKSALIAATLPHPAAAGALKQALSSPDLFAVTPGTAVSVDVSGLPDAAEQQKAKAGLEARLTAAGLKPSPNAPVVLKATLTSAAKDEHYRIFGRGLETVTVNVTRYTSKVELLSGGKPAWQASSGSGPSFHITPKANETLEDAVRNSSKPNYSFFSSVAIPQYVMQPGKNTLGSSSISGF